MDPNTVNVLCSIAASFICDVGKYVFGQNKTKKDCFKIETVLLDK